MAMKSDIDFWTIFINMANIGSDFFLKRLYICQTKRDIQIKNGIKYYRPVPTRKKASPYHNFLPFFSYRGHKSENISNSQNLNMAKMGLHSPECEGFHGEIVQ